MGGDYSIDLPHDWGTAILSLDWDYRSTQYADDPPVPSSRQEGYGLVNAGIKYLDPSDEYSVEFYGTNILNRRYKAVLADTGGQDEIEMDGRPAEWGLRVTAKF